jgi:hypothetical protein
MEHVDKAAIFEDLCRRNQIRREAMLPLLDLRSEYRIAIALAEARERRAIRKRYEHEVRDQIVSEMRVRYGPHWPSETAGRYWLGALISKRLAERYGL